MSLWALTSLNAPVGHAFMQLRSSHSTQGDCRGRIWGRPWWTVGPITMQWAGQASAQYPQRLQVSEKSGSGMAPGGCKTRVSPGKMVDDGCWSEVEGVLVDWVELLRVVCRVFPACST
jgi:hypothetical protein